MQYARLFAAYPELDINSNSGAGIDILGSKTLLLDANGDGATLTDENGASGKTQRNVAVTAKEDLRGGRFTLQRHEGQLHDGHKRS